MPRHLTNRAKFLIERMVLRGAHYRLLVIAALIGLLSVLAGAAVYLFGADLDGGFPAAVWWAFLRLSDPGYLGDDEGVLLRLISTILTVLGYVVFLGALVAIMTQWLNQRMRDLEAGLTPIAEHDHVLIIGWTNRTPTIVQELVMSGGRVRRFLQLHGARTLRIAILAEEVTTELSVELRERLGALWNARQIILRSGSPLRLDHLRRVDFINASAVILPSADYGTGGPDHADSRTVKTLLSMAGHPQLREGTELPLAVAEIFDSQRVDIARRAYPGPVEILASDAIISRLIAQTVRHPGLSYVFGELLTHNAGNEIYVRDCAELTGAAFGDLAAHFGQSVVLGLVRPGDDGPVPVLNPPPDTAVERGDRVALVARSYAGTEPGGGANLPRPRVRLLAGPEPAQAARAAPRRVLLLGWSHKVPALLHEFDSYAAEQFHIDIVSTQSAGARESAIGRHGVKPERIAVSHVEGDFASAALLQRVDVRSYDNIVLLGSARFETGEESDARTIMGYLLLRDLLPEQGGPGVLIELMDAGNLPLFQHRRGEVIVSPMILSHMLAQVALRRELSGVFDELFGPGGAEIVFSSPEEYGVCNTECSFRALEDAAAARGEIALGVRVAQRRDAGGIVLNPSKEQSWTLRQDDEIVSLASS
jgi:ion channel POLLUX/CASTOR